MSLHISTISYIIKLQHDILQTSKFYLKITYLINTANFCDLTSKIESNNNGSVTTQVLLYKKTTIEFQAPHNYHAVQWYLQGTATCNQSHVDILPLLLPRTTSTKVRMIPMRHDPVVVWYGTWNMHSMQSNHTHKQAHIFSQWIPHPYISYTTSTPLVW